MDCQDQIFDWILRRLDGKRHSVVDLAANGVAVKTRIDRGASFRLRKVK